MYLSTTPGNGDPNGTAFDAFCKLVALPADHNCANDSGPHLNPNCPACAYNMYLKSSHVSLDVRLDADEERICQAVSAVIAGMRNLIVYELS